jgi:pimeloyl-ACP methyl ester carboxylesterase
MADILLVHGSCHGAWCWRDVLAPLSALGHRPRAIDLPGHGADATPVRKVTLDGYARAILDALDGPTVVVGHSMAGYPISRAADLDPAPFARLVYLCAYVPAPGLSLADMRRAAPRQPLLDAILVSADGLSFSVDPAKTQEVFYNDCPDGTVAYANPRLCPQAILPQETPLTLGRRYARVPRHYIRCTDDRTIPPEFQVEMTADWPPDQVSEMPTGHSPFFADPEGLARLIDRIATG